jgi:predicted nucleotidyltransferase
LKRFGYVSVIAKNLKLAWSVSIVEISNEFNLSTEVAEWLGTITERIVEHFQPLQLVLFGSQARGDAHANSDIDLLVVLAQVEDQRKTAIAIRRVLADLPIAKDIIVTTPDEISRRGFLIGTVLRQALQEGKVVYERG